MVQKPLELILTRQLAECLTLPVFVVDVRGNLVHYNAPAEKILGRRFDETGELSLEEWSTAFLPTDAQGRPLAPTQLPLVIALRERRPAHMEFCMRGLDRVARRVQVTGFPLIGSGDRLVGAVAIFWEDS